MSIEPCPTCGSAACPVWLREKRPTLGQELADLERTDPKVAAAAASYDEMVKRVIEGRSHAIPCTLPDCPWHTP